MANNVNIGAYVTRFKGRMGRFKRGVLLELFAAVIKDTPVLTGRLRANWTFSKGHPPAVFREGVDDSTAAMTAGVNANVDDKDASYYLANSMPYCNRIEYLGHSKSKAPQGMVRKNMIRITNLLRQSGRNPANWTSGKGV
jgi:hypothetical protein